MVPSWFPAAYRDTLPEHAVKATTTCEVGPVLVGRIFHETEMLPAMVLTGKLAAIYTKDNKVYSKAKYDVLVGHGYSWKECTMETIPSNAVKFDNQKNDETIYIGRATYNDTICVGRVDLAQECLFFPYNGRELRAKTFEILIVEQNGDWVSTSFYYTPSDAVEGGRDTDGSPIYVGRALHNGQWLPCKVIPNKTCAYYCSDGVEIFVREYQVLRGHGYFWHHVYGHFIPSNAVSTGTTENGEPLYIGRGNFNKSITPGLISVSEKCCTFPYGGKEITVYDYEVLLK